MNTLEAMDIETLLRLVKGSGIRIDERLKLEERLKMELAAILTREQLLGTYEYERGYY